MKCVTNSNCLCILFTSSLLTPSLSFRDVCLAEKRIADPTYRRVQRVRQHFFTFASAPRSTANFYIADSHARVFSCQAVGNSGRISFLICPVSFVSGRGAPFENFPGVTENCQSLLNLVIWVLFFSLSLRLSAYLSLVLSRVFFLSLPPLVSFSLSLPIDVRVFTLFSYVRRFKKMIKSVMKNTNTNVSQHSRVLFSGGAAICRFRVKRHDSSSVPLRHPCAEPPKFIFSMEEKSGTTGDRFLFLPCCEQVRITKRECASAAFNFTEQIAGPQCPRCSGFRYWRREYASLVTDRIVKTSQFPQKISCPLFLLLHLRSAAPSSFRS